MPSRDALRRYPALGFLAVAAGLALILPSRLNNPATNPTSLSEFAPVPGESKGRSDASVLGRADSGGLGSGSGLDGAAAQPTPPQPGSIRGRPKTPSLLPCVGDPPQQTEDPLSPPCVASFEGSNGGATAKGVTGDSITVIVDVDANDRTDPGRFGSIVDCAEGISPNDTGGDHLCKAYMLFFNARYQTYGRRVRLLASHSAAVADADQRFGPFAHAGEFPTLGWAKAGTVAVGYSGTLKAQYVENAPHMVGFRPDQDESARIAASFICAKLHDRPARFSGTQTEREKRRRFGIWSEANEKYDDHLAAQLEAQCGIAIPESARVEGYQPGTATAPARLRDEGVTTVLLSLGKSGMNIAQQYATQVGYFPEWFIPGKLGLRDTDTNFYARTFDQTQWRNAFGLTFDYLRSHYTVQHWYRSYKDGCPTCPEPGTAAYSRASFMYDGLNMLFWSIQAAGPKLTAQNVVRGLRSIPPQRSDDPTRPAAYFSQDGYTFVKDAMAISWDISGSPPGQSGGGCYRMARGGLRYRAGDWEPGDDDLFIGTDPCQGDAIPGQ